jgi:hypothetical protein
MVLCVRRVRVIRHSLTGIAALTPELRHELLHRFVLEDLNLRHQAITIAVNASHVHLFHHIIMMDGYLCMFCAVAR